MNVLAILLKFCGGNRLRLVIAAGIVILVALILGGMLWRISALKIEVSRLRADLRDFNATLISEQARSVNAVTRANLASADKARLLSALEGLQAQLNASRRINRDYTRKLARAQQIARSARAVNPDQTSGVIDEATSNSTVQLLNSVFLRP